MLESLSDHAKATWDRYLAETIKRYGPRAGKRVDEASRIFSLDTIRQSEAKNAKALLSRTCEEVYDSWRDKIRSSEDLRDAEDRIVPDWRDICYWSFGFHVLNSFSRKLEKLSTPTDGAVALVDDARNLLVAFRLIGDKVAEKLKEAVPGRRPAENARVDDTERFTCPCCIRQIALQPGWKTMAHHGYTRPFLGMQTGSCAGVNFEPLEKSLDGLVWKIGSLKKGQENFQHELEKLPEADKLVFETAEGIKSFSRSEVSDVKWQKLFARKKADLESTIRFISREIEFFESTLAQWTDRHTAEIQPDSGMRP